MIAPALILTDVHVDRDGTRIVHGLDATITQGAWLGVIGANGSGKTTLLRAIAGRLPIATGTLLLDGTECAQDRAARAAHIGFAPDGDTLPGLLSGRELFGLVAGRPVDLTADDELQSLRAALDVAAIADLPVATCSAGMRQRLALYCAFAGGQRIVILDEPYNWLDPLAAFDLRHALRALVDRGYTLITALHDLSALPRACDTGLLLRDGRVALRIDADQMRDAARDPDRFERTTIDHLRAWRP